MTTVPKQCSDAARAHRLEPVSTLFSATACVGWWGSDHVQVSVPEGRTQSAETVELCAACPARLRLPPFTAPGVSSPLFASLKSKRALTVRSLIARNTARVRRASARMCVRGDHAKGGDLVTPPSKNTDE